MKKSDKKYPFPVPEMEQDSLADYCCPSASWGDMTGLIPYVAGNDGEVEAYNEVYQYLPGYTDIENINNEQK